MCCPKASAVERQPECEDRLDLARALYKALVAEYPDKSIMLYDDHGVMLLAHTDGGRDVTASLLLSEQ